MPCKVFPNDKYTGATRGIPSHLGARELDGKLKNTQSLCRVSAVERQKLLSQNRNPPQVLGQPARHEGQSETQLGLVAECVDMKSKDER